MRSETDFWETTRSPLLAYLQGALREITYSFFSMRASTDSGMDYRDPT